MPSSRPQGFDERAEEFLLHEFQTQREMRASLNSLVASEINIYVAIVGATFLGLAFLGDVVPSDGVNEDDHLVLGVALGALILVLLLGCAMYSRVVTSRITVVQYARNLNRVRNYFVNQYKAISQYASSDIYDDKPPFGAVGHGLPFSGAISGNTGLIAIINSTCIAGIIGIGYRLFNIASSPILTVSGVGVNLGIISLISGFIVSLAAHHWYQKRQYEKAKDKWIENFPTPKQS